MTNLDNLNTIETNSIEEILNIYKDAYLTYTNWWDVDSLGCISSFESFYIAGEEMKALYDNPVAEKIARIMAKAFEKRDNFNEDSIYYKEVKELLKQGGLNGN